MVWLEVAQHFPRWLVQCLHLSQEFKRPPYWNGWSYGIKQHGVEVAFSGMTSVPNTTKLYYFVQKLLVGDAQTGSQAFRQEEWWPLHKITRKDAGKHPRPYRYSKSRPSAHEPKTTRPREYSCHVTNTAQTQRGCSSYVTWKHNTNVPEANLI
jgi:hypothetical protein